MTGITRVSRRDTEPLTGFRATRESRHLAPQVTAVGRRDEPAAGLELLRSLADEPELARHHPYHVALALYLDEVGEPDAAQRAWLDALDLVENSAQRRFIEQRLR